MPAFIQNDYGKSLICNILLNFFNSKFFTFEELFKMAKDADESEEMESAGDSGENENQNTNENPERPEVTGNYSKVSADKLWKDNK